MTTQPIILNLLILNTLSGCFPLISLILTPKYLVCLLYQHLPLTILPVLNAFRPSNCPVLLPQASLSSNSTVISLDVRVVYGFQHTNTTTIPGNLLRHQRPPHLRHLLQAALIPIFSVTLHIQAHPRGSLPRKAGGNRVRAHVPSGCVAVEEEE